MSAAAIAIEPQLATRWLGGGLDLSEMKPSAGVESRGQSGESPWAFIVSCWPAAL
jgi:hypothetical protein